MYIVLIISSKG